MEKFLEYGISASRTHLSITPSFQHSGLLAGGCKTLIAGCSKNLRCEAREKSTSGGVLFALRWSEAIERNEAYAVFSAAF